MSIRKAFIPCAGFGTRMGPVGLRYPKPLWALFDVNLLDVQISLLKSYGVEDIIINTHHLADHFVDKVSKVNINIENLYEDKLLGSGGSFFNVKKQVSDVGKVIILNSDIQLLLSDSDQRKLQELFLLEEAVLVCLPVKRELGYNRVRFDKDNFFLEVTPPDAPSYFTYSGFGMVNVSLLEGGVATSSFFDTVVNNKFFKTKIFIPQDDYEYWDWGTLDLYKSNIKTIASKESSKLKDFLTVNRLMREDLLSLNSYNSNDGVYNFTNTNLHGLKDEIVFYNTNEELIRIEF